MLPYITSLPSTFANTPEPRYWTESLLTRHCMLSSLHVSANQMSPSISAVPPSRILAPFRAYSKYWDTKSASNMGTLSKAGDRHSSYARTWGYYYDTLSVLLQRETTQHVFDSRLQHGAELKKVEATYENILLKETNYPRADQANSQIESWVDQVMANWRVMCGRTWQDEDLGEGGKAVLGRGVLDVGRCPDMKIFPGHGKCLRIRALIVPFTGSLSSSYQKLSFNKTTSPFIHRTCSYSRILYCGQSIRFLFSDPHQGQSKS